MPCWLPSLRSNFSTAGTPWLLVLSVVLTTHAEFCPGAIELQEWLVENYRLRLLLEGPGEDGEEPEHLTSCFRRDLRIIVGRDDPGYLRYPQ
jgi:hypothetical protein